MLKHLKNFRPSYWAPPSGSTQNTKISLTVLLNLPLGGFYVGACFSRNSMQPSSISLGLIMFSPMLSLVSRCLAWKGRACLLPRLHPNTSWIVSPFICFIWNSLLTNRSWRYAWLNAPLAMLPAKMLQDRFIWDDVPYPRQWSNRTFSLSIRSLMPRADCPSSIKPCMNINKTTPSC